jgi:FlaA1/EpsC-like NDP-sugar epimerase
VNTLARAKIVRANLIYTRRLASFLLGDTILLGIVIYLALFLRFEGVVPARLLSSLPLVWGFSVAVKTPFLYRQRLYSVSWSFVGMEDLLRVLRAVTYGSVIFAAVVLILRYFEVLPAFPLSALFLDYAFSLAAIAGFRISRRVYLHTFRRSAVGGEPTMLVGAGESGEQLVRSLLASPNAGYTPVGFVDDDPAKHGTTLHGVPVLGSRSQIPSLVRQYRASRVVIAMPSASSQVVREVVALSRSAGIKNVSILPALTHLLNGQVSPADLREVRLEDLLGREVVSISTRDVEVALRAKRVLVTGAGGTIGAELCRQIVHFSPSSLVVLDHEETALFDINRELQAQTKNSASTIIPVLADIRDTQKVQRLFQAIRPEMVFHAAAYKHVGILEWHLEEAVRTNVGGTAILAQAALTTGSELFVLISTDKAVNPTSAMGATKRVAEELCLALNRRGQTRFMAVRFGNVLGSRGSVLPIFQEQIRRGGPVTVRGPNARRYFMAVSEAVLLVLQAGTMGLGEEVFVLDMGEPIKIVDLARELIRLSGLEPDRDIPIVFTELEPGEKEFEDILTAEEGTIATRHEKIYVARLSSPVPAEQVLHGVGRLRDLAEQGAKADILRLLQELVPNYRPSVIALSADANPMNMKPNLRPNPRNL